MRRKVLVFFGLLFILNLMFLVQSHSSLAVNPEKRVALVIGNSAYQNTPSLPNPRNDAIEIGKVLKRLGYDVNVQVDLNKPDMDKALRQFGDRLEGAQVALFYYAGHGIQVAGNNYLIPVDAKLQKEKDLDFEVSDLGLVLRQMEGAQRVNLVFLDACRDNPLSKRLAEGMGSGRSVQIGRGLAPMKASDGTLISYATKDGEVASDGKGKHSPFTQAILNHIESPLEISQMLRKVREDVKKLTDNRQTPWEYGSLTGDFYFTGPVKVEIVPESPKADSGSKVETLYWQSIMNDTDPAVFEAYLKKYPDGEFADLAQIKIGNLIKGQKNEGLPSSAQPVPSATPQPEYRLTIDSNPADAKIKVLNTPVKYKKGMMLKPGTYPVEISRDGYEPFSTVIEIRDADVISPITLKELAKGSIRVTSDPSGASVSMDGKKIGVTPVDINDISPGQKKISIEKTGHKPVIQTASIKSGQQTQLDVRLDASGCVLRITSDVQVSDVYIDGEKSGTTPVELKNISAGNHRIVVRKDGYFDFTQAITVEPQIPAQIHAGLIRSSPTKPPPSQPSQPTSYVGGINTLTTSSVETFSALDTTRWEEWNNGNTKVSRQYGNGLTLSGGPNEKVEGGICSRFYLSGNFDIEISYEILKWPFYENPQLERQKRAFILFYVTNGKKSSDRITANVARYNSPRGTFEGYANGWLNEGKWQYGEPPNHLSHSKGKLRLKRFNGKFEAFYDDSGVWKTMPEYPGSCDMPVLVGLCITNFSSERKVDPTEVEVRFTDLKISLK